MVKRIITLILVTAALLVPGCQAGPAGQTTAESPPPETGPAGHPTPSPTEAAAPSPTATAPRPTPITALEASFTPTDLPAPTPFSGPCFTVREANPFTFTPQGTGIALRTIDGVQLINLETMEEEAFLQAPQNVYGAALSPDGETLAWSLEDNSIQLLRVADGAVLHTLEGHPDPVFKLRFSPSGDRLYSTSHDSWVRTWDLQGNLVGSFQPTGGEVLGIGISPDGNTLAAIPSDGPVVLWDVETNRKLAELATGTGGYDTSDASFSPDGQYLAVDLATGLFIWRVSDGELAWEEHPHTMTGDFSPDGQTLAYADLDQGNRVLLLSPGDFQPVSNLEMNPEGVVWELFFSPDGSKLAATDGIEVRIWGIEAGELLSVGKVECP